MVLVAMGLGSTIGVVPAVMTDRFARLNHGYDDPAMDCSDYRTDDKPQACWLGSADAQTAVATSNLISNALTFLTSSMMGSLSDEYGRKFILVGGLAMGCIPPLLLYVIQIVPSMSPWWYYSMTAATGLVNWVAVALSALADVLPHQYRAPGIGLLLAGFMLGFSLSPILSVLLSRLHLSLVSFLVVTMGLVCTVFFVPETLPPHVAEEAKRRRRRMQQQRHHAITTSTTTSSTASLWFQMTLHILLRPFREMAILNRNTFFRLISSLAFFSGMVSSGDQVLLVYYLEDRLGFTNRDVSLMFLIMGIMGLFAQAVLLKPINDCLGEKHVVALAFFCGAIDNMMYGLAKNKQTIFAAVGIASLTGMAFPTISAIKANNVEESEQGRIQGALYSLQALASGLGPATLKFVYSKTKDSVLGPGAMFVFAGCLYLVAVAIACSLPKEKANAPRTNFHYADDDDNGDDDTSSSNGSGGVLGRRTATNSHDLEEYMHLASDSSSSDEEDYGTMTQNR
jgi:DHA1 family tetracycline resistance protein-like MFS transporter